jgi:hypothetical protein
VAADASVVAVDAKEGRSRAALGVGERRSCEGEGGGKDTRKFPPCSYRPNFTRTGEGRPTLNANSVCPALAIPRLGSNELIEKRDDYLRAVIIVEASTAMRRSV